MANFKILVHHSIKLKHPSNPLFKNNFVFDTNKFLYNFAYTRSKIPAVHPDLDGLSYEDFDEECKWDHVALTFIPNFTYYKLWDSSFPITREISKVSETNPIILTMYTYIRPLIPITYHDSYSYVINAPSNDAYVTVYNFEWLPLGIKLTSGPIRIFLKLTRAQRGTKSSGVATGTGLVLSSARTLFTYEPVKSIRIDKNHCWFSLPPHSESNFNLELIRKLPLNTSCPYLTPTVIFRKLK